MSWRSYIVGVLTGFALGSSIAYALTSNQIWRAVYAPASQAIEVTIVP